MASHLASPRIALIVDNPFRDLPGLTLVAWRLCQMGATCYLVPMNLQRTELWPLAPDFALINYVRTNNEDFVRRLLEARIRLGILDTEGGLFAPIPEGSAQANNAEALGPDLGIPFDDYGVSLTKDADLRQRMAFLCAWAQPFADYAARAGWFSPQQTVVTGSPRMDFYTDPWKAAARRLTPSADAYPQPLVLVNGNFSLANPQFKTPQEELELRVNHNYDRAFIEQQQQTQVKAMRLLVELTNYLARRFPAVSFVYRPHPFENVERYKELMEPLPNLHLVKEGTVEAWLLRATALLHWSSSTSLNAALYGIPVFTGEWIPVHAITPIARNLTVRCPTPEALAEELEAVLRGDYRQPASIQADLARIITGVYHRIDGLAHQRVAETVWQAANTGLGQVDIEYCRQWVYGGEPGGRHSPRAVLSLTLKSRLGLSPHWSFRRFSKIYPSRIPWDDSQKRFDAPQVQRIVDALAAASPQALPPVKVVAAQDGGAYHFGFALGRSVALLPSQR